MSYNSFYAAQPIPRYTSYPTANRFGVLDHATVQYWLRALDPGEPVSLYFHIPFCRTLCWYCGCHTSITKLVAPVTRYINSLIEEIDLVCGAVGHSLPVAHIHFGGGTPNSIEPDDLERLMKSVHKSFDVQADAEIAMELDPRVLTPEFAEMMARVGVNRASFGIQDVSEDVQCLINRIQSIECVKTAMGLLEKNGIDKVNFDLIYGLPAQTIDHVERSADAAIELGADRVAVFGYAHVPWFKKHQQVIDVDMLPGGKSRYEQAAAMARRLVAGGMVAIGLDHFSKPDDTLSKALENKSLRRNFQGYTSDSADTIIRFGASSISHFPQGFAQNEPHILRYRSRIAAAELATARGVACNHDDRFRAHLIERLMCVGEVDLDASCQQFDLPVSELDEARESLVPLIADGLASMHGSVLHLSGTGRTYARCVAACFDRYLTMSDQQHSRAV